MKYLKSRYKMMNYILSNQFNTLYGYKSDSPIKPKTFTTIQLYRIKLHKLNYKVSKMHKKRTGI